MREQKALLDGSPFPLLSRQDVQELLEMPEAMAVVERAFKLAAQGEAIMPAKIYLQTGTGAGDFRAMPACIDDVAGMKWVSVFPENRRHGLPAVLATIILNDPGTGQPVAIMDGTLITEMRTGAAGGIAAKYLARPDSQTVGLIGAGVQARTQLRAILAARPAIRRVNIFDRDPGASARLAEEVRAKHGLSARAVAAVEEAAKVDILVTTTPSTVPVVMDGFVAPGTHINAIGADAAGKQELDNALVKRAKVFVDDFEQATHSGEINVPLAMGILGRDEIRGTLGEIIANLKPGRTSDKEITIFDSTGLAIQDIVCAKLVLEKARARCAVLR